MAKFTSSIEDMFTSKQDTITPNSILQKRGNKTPQKYHYGKKVNIMVDEEIWEDILILLKIKGLKQIKFFNGILLKETEKNREIIDSFKKLYD